MDATFRAGGLASGLDTNLIVDNLVKLESRPLALLQQRQVALKTQVSTLGDLLSRLDTLRTATKALADGGLVAFKAQGTNTSFAATPGSDATAGRYRVEVKALATAASARSAAFAGAGAAVRGGTLELEVDGKRWTVELADGAPLSDAAKAINASGAPVSAALLSSGGSTWLSVTRRDTGYAGDDPAAALRLTETSSGTQGASLGLQTAVQASNALVEVDGLAMVRTSNTVSDAVPGTTLELRAEGPAETLVLGHDVEGTADNLEKVISAYNGVMQLLHRQLAITEASDRRSTLAGDASVRALQSSLRALISSPLGGSGAVRSLADLGLKSSSTGQLSLDRGLLSSALSRDPAAINALVRGAETGLAAATGRALDVYTDPIQGRLTQRQKSMNKSIGELDDEAERIQLRIDKYRERLIQQFTAMEKAVSSAKSIGDFLARQESAANRKD